MNPVNHSAGSAGHSAGHSAGRSLGRAASRNASEGAVSASATALASGCTCFKLRSLSRRVTQLYDQTLSPSGLKVTQYSVIAHARRKAGGVGAASAPTVSELADALFTDRTTLTRNLKPLVDAGFIEIVGGADARSKAVCVTPAGEAAFQAARPLWKQAQGRMRNLAGDDQLAALHGLIEAILPQIEEVNEAAA